MARELTGWKCTQCHVLNEPTAFQCFRCGCLREGVVVQAVLPEGTGERLTLFEGSAAGPNGHLIPHARCTYCDRPLRPEWVACPHCGTKAVTPTTEGARGVLSRILPWILPAVLALMVVTGLWDLFIPRKALPSGNTPARSAANAAGPDGQTASGANGALSPGAVAAWIQKYGLPNVPAERGAGNTPSGNVPRTNNPAGNAASAANGPANVPAGKGSAPNTPAPPATANAPETGSKPVPASAGERVVDPAPRAATGDTGLTVKDVAWVEEGGLNEIKGTVHNTTANRYKFVRITFDLLDKNGASVGTAMDSLTQLRRGRSKEFTVLVMQPEAVHCRLKSVEAD